MEAQAIIYNIKRESSCLRPLYISGMQINRICLHDGDKVLHTIQQGWLEHTEIKGGYPYTGSRDVVAINAEVRKANKMNLSKRDNFIMSYADKDKSYYEQGKALYLYTPDFKIEKCCTYTLDNDLDTIEYNILKFSLDCLVSMPILVDGKLAWQDEHFSTLRIVHTLAHGKTALGQDLQSLADQINTALGRDYNRGLSANDVKLLQKQFTITAK